MIIGDSVILGGGGEAATIVVTAPTGSTVTMSHGGETTTGTEVSGTWTFKAREYGTYTVTATKDGETATKTVVVDAATEYIVELSYGWDAAPSNGIMLGTNGTAYVQTQAVWVPSSRVWRSEGVLGRVVFSPNTTAITFTDAYTTTYGEVTLSMGEKEIQTVMWGTERMERSFAIPPSYIDGREHEVWLTGRYYPFISSASFNV